MGRILHVRQNPSGHLDLKPTVTRAQIRITNAGVLANFSVRPETAPFHQTSFVGSSTSILECSGRRSELEQWLGET